MYVCLYVCMSVCRSFEFGSNSPCIKHGLYILLGYLGLFRGFNLSICLSVYLTSQMTKNIHYFTIYIYKSICLSVYLSVCLSICLSVYLSVCQPVNLSVCLSVITDDQKYTHNKQVKYIHYFKIHIYKSICLSV